MKTSRSLLAPYRSKSLIIGIYSIHVVPIKQITLFPLWPCQAVDCVTCSMCSRKIPGHRLSIHERSCRKLTSSANKTPEQITESLCYVCKLRFPISTLASHEVDCLQQWQAKQEGRPTPTPSIPAEKSEQKKPDNRSMVDAEPVKEESSLESGDILPLDVECKELNQEDGSTSDEGRGNSQKLPSDNATETSANLSGETSETNQNTEIKTDEAWSQHIAQLVPCRKCGRTFLPERLDKHVKNCKLKPVKKKVWSWVSWDPLHTSVFIFC